MAWASTVAVVVPSPATSDVLLATSFTICAPMFSSGSLSSISFATVTPSLVIVGDPNFLSRMTLRPFGPSVTLTALVRLLTPLRTACREASPYVICFAIMCSVNDANRIPSWRGLRFLPADLLDREDFLLLHDQILHAIELDFLTGVLAEQTWQPPGLTCLRLGNQRN